MYISAIWEHALQLVAERDRYVSSTFERVESTRVGMFCRLSQHNAHAAAVRLQVLADVVELTPHEVWLCKRKATASCSTVVTNNQHATALQRISLFYFFVLFVGD